MKQRKTRKIQDPTTVPTRHDQVRLIHGLSVHYDLSLSLSVSDLSDRDRDRERYVESLDPCDQSASCFTASISS